ncbi:MAG: hypothetical protein V3V20_02085 [Algisphaera sp.]
MAAYQPHHPEAPRLEAGVDADELVLIKGGRRFVFPCPPGGEAALLTQLRLMVDDPETGLNWFDAAVVSHEMGQRMSDRLSHQIPPPRRRSA